VLFSWSSLFYFGTAYWVVSTFCSVIYWTTKNSLCRQIVKSYYEALYIFVSCGTSRADILSFSSFEPNVISVPIQRLNIDSRTQSMQSINCGSWLKNGKCHHSCWQICLFSNTKLQGARKTQFFGKENLQIYNIYRKFASSSSDELKSIDLKLRMFQEQHVVYSKTGVSDFFCFVFVFEDFRIFLEQTPQQPITKLSHIIFLRKGMLL